MTIPDDKLKSIAKSFEMHLGKAAFAGMKKNRDKLNQINMTSGRTETNQSVLLRSIRVAEELRRRGFGLGDVILLCGVNHDDLSLPLLASTYIGSAVVPLSVEMSIVELKHMANVTNPKIAFCDSSVANKIKKVFEELNIKGNIVVFGDLPDSSFIKFEEFQKPSGVEEDFEIADLDPVTTTAFIICSSGTTGFPKGVCLTHRNVSSQINLPRIGAETWVEEQEKFIIFSSLFWFSGILPIMMSCQYNVIRVYTPLPYEPGMAIEAFNKYKPNICLLSPLSIMALLRHPKIDECDFSSFKAFITVGSPIPQPDIENLQRRITKGFVVNSYGLTETTGSVCASMKNKPNSCGRPMPWIKWKVVDVETRKELGPMERGELLLNCEYIMFKEYANNPQATTNSFDDGWLKTGDIIYYDEEGDFYIVDRLKEMIKFRDMQIAPAQVEHEISKVPGVLANCVVGVPSEQDGSRPMAYVQLLPGANVSATEIKDAVKKNLSYSRQLSGGVVFMDTLPTTPSGKINRRILNEMKLTVKAE